MYTSEHSIKFSEKTVRNHIVGYSKYILHEVPAMIALSLSLWGLASIGSHITDREITLRGLAIPVLLVSFVIGVYKSYARYRRYTPEILLNESEKAKEIFRLQRCGWQYSLAEELIDSRFKKIDLYLQRLSSGSEFVPPRIISDDEYIDWLQERPSILMRLIESVSLQCTQDIPSCLGDITDESGLVELKDSVFALVKLYDQAKIFELESREIVPPDRFTSIHELIYGWTDPIRLGMVEFVGVLKELGALSRRDVKRIKAGSGRLPEFLIEFHAPNNIDEFVNKMHKLQV